MGNEWVVCEAGGLAREGIVSGPGIPVAAITQQACLLWNIARGKRTGYTEENRDYNDGGSSQQLLSLTKGSAKDSGEKHQLQTAIAPLRGPFLGTGHHPSLGTERSFPWAAYHVPTGEAQCGQIIPEATAFSRLVSRPLDLDLGSSLKTCSVSTPKGVGPSLRSR